MLGPSSLIGGNGRFIKFRDSKTFRGSFLKLSWRQVSAYSFSNCVFPRADGGRFSVCSMPYEHERRKGNPAGTNGGEKEFVS